MARPLSSSASFSLPLQSTLRPEWVRWIQRTYFTSTDVQLLATAGLLVVAILGIVGAIRLQHVVSRRYGKQIGEVTSILALALVVLAVVYGFSIVWYVTFIIELVLDSLAISRWEAARQIVTAGVAATAYLAIRFANRSIDRLAQTRALTKHQSEIAYHVTDVTIIAVAGTLILTIWGIELTNVFIGAGAITAIVALTARETLAGMLAGFVLLFSRPFYVGDWIEVNETGGIVTDVTIFTTKIQTFDDKHVMIPNDEVTSSQVTNYSRNDQLRIEVEVGVDYDTDIAHAREVIAEAVDDLESIKNSPNPQVVTKGFGDSSILLECHAWIGDPTMRRTHSARTDVIDAIATAFDREGISIPYPQRVHSAREDGFRLSGPNRGSAELSTSHD